MKKIGGFFEALSFCVFDHEEKFFSVCQKKKHESRNFVFLVVFRSLQSVAYPGEAGGGAGPLATMKTVSFCSTQMGLYFF